MFGITLLLLYLCGFIASVFGTDSLNGDGIYMIVLLMFSYGIAAFLAKNEAAHHELIQRMYVQISNQEFLKLVLDTHSSGLLILNGECSITFSNSVFDTLFADHIKRAKAQPASPENKGEGEGG